MYGAGPTAASFLQEGLAKSRFYGKIEEITHKPNLE